MTLVKIEFGPKPMEKLIPLGVKLHTLRGPVSLRASSFFEPPVSVLAQVSHPTMLEVGAFTSISGGKIGNVKFGRYCSVAPEVVIGAHEHPVDWLTSSRVGHYPEVNGWDVFCRPEDVDFIHKNRKRFTISCRTTHVGNDVWIGQGAFIKSGVTLGTGSIIAARSVVVQDVPPYAIVAGTPARVKRYRFEEQTIERLLKLEWWRYSLYDVFNLPFDDVPRAISGLEEMIASGTVEAYQPACVTAENLRDLFAADK